MEPVRYTARDDDNIVNILRMVQEAEVNAVPVLDASEKLMGLLTNSSLVATLSRQFLTEERGWQTDECLPGRVCQPHGLFRHPVAANPLPHH